jgi:O-antigen/teichoic acid export membrane protein
MRGVLGNVSAQLVVILVSLVTVPIGLHYFGPGQYGAWLVIESILVILGLSQYGIRTASAALIAAESSSAARRHILVRALAILALISFFLIAATLILTFFETLWMKLFGNIPSGLAHDAYRASFIVLLFYLIRLPLVVFSSAFTGVQDTHLERLYISILPYSLGFVSLLVTISINGDLITLAWLTGIAHLVAAIGSGLHLFIRHPGFRPGRNGDFHQNSVANHELTRRLFRSGNKFFIVGIAAIFVWGTDNLVISVLSGAGNVTPYAVTFRAFMVAYAGLSVVNFALWPMLAKAVTAKDWIWVGSVYRTLLSVLPILGSAIWIGGIAFAQPVIEMWAGPAGYGGSLVVFALGAYAYLLSQIGTTSSFLSATNAPQVGLAVSEAVINLVLSIVLFYWLGIGGVAVATALAALLTAFWALPRVIARNTGGRVATPWRTIGHHFLFAVVPAVSAMLLISHYLEGVNRHVTAAVILAAYLLASWLLLPVADRSELRVMIRRLLPIGRT